MRVRFSTVVALVLALAILSTLPSHAALKSPGQAQQAGLFSRFVGFLGNLPSRLVAAWGEAGFAIDPFGGQGDTHPEDSSDTDAGSGVDPWGRK